VNKDCTNSPQCKYHFTEPSRSQIKHFLMKSCYWDHILFLLIFLVYNSKNSVTSHVSEAGENSRTLHQFPEKRNHFLRDIQVRAVESSTWTGKPVTISERNTTTMNVAFGYSLGAETVGDSSLKCRKTTSPMMEIT